MAGCDTADSLTILFCNPLLSSHQQLDRFVSVHAFPADKLIGLEKAIHPERDRKLEEAREIRRQRRQADRANEKTLPPINFREVRRQVNAVKRWREELSVW